MKKTYTLNLVVEGEEKDIEKFIENNVVSCPHIQIKNVEKAGWRGRVLKTKTQPFKDKIKNIHI